MLIDDFNRIIEEFNQPDLPSGCILHKVHTLILTVIDYTPVNASSYLPLPWVTKSLINIKNTDNECFKYSIYAYFILKDHPDFKDPQRVKKISNI